MRKVILYVALCSMFVACARELPEDTTAVIVTSDLQVNYGCDELYASYFSTGDSSQEIQSVVDEFSNDLNEKGNDLEIVSNNGRFIISILRINLREEKYDTSVDDPCDTTGTQTLNYSVSDLTAYMSVSVYDIYTGLSEEVSAEANSSEDVKDHPTIFQMMIGRDSCYTPSVRNAHPGMMKNRMVRRLYRRTMYAIRSMMQA